uniref:Uncharacterized protein n=1 Tax=Physcomitrium patens TaxID=3218 RepID=A0A2K1KTG9_PHYPA|nr:hypothetical protein PHYPA_004077 [Physcomitrium patens]
MSNKQSPNFIISKRPGCSLECGQEMRSRSLYLIQVSSSPETRLKERMLVNGLGVKLAKMWAWAGEKRMEKEWRWVA